MDYLGVPTTVFTPLEYGCVGLTEVEAYDKFGVDKVTCYHIAFQPLEWQYNKARPESHECYTKVLVTQADNKVVGFHIVCPNAGEITQGIGIAMKCGMTKDQLDSCVGIHPTIAEEVIGLTKNKKDEPNAKKGGC